MAMGALEQPTGLSLKHYVYESERADYLVPYASMEKFVLPPAALAAAKAAAEAAAAAKAAAAAE